MPLTNSSLAPAVGAAVENVQFQAAAQVLSRKILLIGTYDPAKTGITPEDPFLITSPEDAAAKLGFGFMLHRMAKAANAGSQGVETWVMPQAEAGGATASAGSIDFAGSTLTENGTIHLYIGGDAVPIVGAKGDDGAALATKAVAAITADPDLPVTAAVGTPTSLIDITCKSKGPFGDDIALSFNQGFMESDPAGLAYAVVDMTGGAGIPDIDDALDATGTGDDQNEAYYTDVLHGYGLDSTTLDKLSVYNGEANDFLGDYSKTVSRPFRSLNGDTTPGSGGLSTLLALGNGRKSDRTNGVIAVPASPNHPVEIACLALGTAARLNSNRAEEHVLGKILSGVFPGAKADRWTSDYDDRDTAVKAGISPTRVRSASVYMQNLLTFYHPDSVPSASNGYRSMRDISIIQNMLYNLRLTFEQEKWQGCSIVEDVAKVGSLTDREKARDIDAVLDELLALTNSFYDLAWIYSTGFTIDKLKAGGLIEIRPGGKGFNMRLPVLFSGEAWIYDGLIQFDTALTVVL